MPLFNETDTLQIADLESRETDGRPLDLLHGLRYENRLAQAFYGACSNGPKPSSSARQWSTNCSFAERVIAAMHGWVIRRSTEIA